MPKRIALYHRVMRRENFEKVANDLLNLLKSAQVKYPNKERVLYVDIEGHKNPQGGFDHDMFELQKDFGIGFLGKFFSEVHFPLIDYINPNPQCNDIPDKLDIFPQESDSENQPNSLYIENYSNTEFAFEPDVHSYLQKVHDFLIEYQNYDFDCMIHEGNQNQANHHIRLWKTHICELINELYNSFIYGNLFSIAAMTRTLIECFVFYSILIKPGNEQLIHHWYICNMCHTRKDSDRLQEIVRAYCQVNQLDFTEMWSTYSTRPSTKRWLRPLMPKGKTPTFELCCNYLGDAHIYEDYESACAFVYGQDLSSKILPFTFYHSICYRFDMMMLYIFRTLRLFPLNTSLKAQITDLEDELILLSEKYLREYQEGFTLNDESD